MIFTDKRALSPVISGIILIAVTIAVAIAATTWLGSTTISFMSIEELKITNCQWASDASYVDLTINNFGTESATINDAKVNGKSANNVSIISGNSNIKAGETITLRINQNFSDGKKYRFSISTSKGSIIEHVNTATFHQINSEGWFDSNWPKRKQIVIDNRLNSNNLSNYQINLDLNYDADMNPNFSDLRFTTNDSKTLIPYWIENQVSSVSSNLWINIPFILSSSNTTIFLYYGNPSAESLSNPDETFDIFLNFTRDNLISYGGSQDSNPSQYQIIDDVILKMWGNNWKAIMKNLNVNGDGSQVIQFDYKSNGSQPEINGIGLDTDNSISSNRFYRIFGSQNWGINHHFGYSGGGNWQSYTLTLNDFSGSFNRFVFTNDADGGQNTNIYYKNIRIAKYSSPESQIELLSEETF